MLTAYSYVGDHIILQVEKAVGTRLLHNCVCLPCLVLVRGSSVELLSAAGAVTMPSSPRSFSSGRWCPRLQFWRGEGGEERRRGGEKQGREERNKEEEERRNKEEEERRGEEGEG